MSAATHHHNRRMTRVGLHDERRVSAATPITAQGGYMLRSFRFRSMLLASALAGVTHPAFAQDAAPAPSASPAAAPGGQVDPRIMLELMVQKGLVSRAEADDIIRR